ncbi:hypothetical protein N7495_008387 [Penicillium taxi]|uniref:uncharacterized protein n=1 Tax=Penicillium taxi TaxID=168475 RepID=UPI0025457F51|nr:uncharacterized protein N7495_008387 [Penicillium taxi]KAJ5888346.1 hypothetical protein N7495_008387 [Penicillium taxi]
MKRFRRLVKGIGVADPVSLGVKFDSNLGRVAAYLQPAFSSSSCFSSSENSTALSVSIGTISQRLHELVKGGLEIGSNTAKVSIELYAERNRIYHADALHKSSKALHELLVDGNRDWPSEELAEIVKLWVPAGKWRKDHQGKSSNKVEKEEKKQQEEEKQQKEEKQQEEKSRRLI